MHDDVTLTRVLPSLTTGTLQGPWARVVALQYLAGPPPGFPVGSAAQPLWPGSAPLVGARFTP